jgi:hypothetical protein
MEPGSLVFIRMNLHKPGRPSIHRGEQGTMVEHDGTQAVDKFAPKEKASRCGARVVKKPLHVSSRMKVQRFPANRPSARASMNAIREIVKPYCQRYCGRNVKTARSKLCGICFRGQAVVSGARSSGNATARGTLGNSGNATASGTLDNSGNRSKGQRKQLACARSGLKRFSTTALVVKKHWLDLILAGEKNWEIRGVGTTRRGWIHLAESKATGKLMGRVRLVDCRAIARESFMEHAAHHRLKSVEYVKYKNIYAWVLEKAERFDKPFDYRHAPGAVIWVKTRCD